MTNGNRQMRQYFSLTTQRTPRANFFGGPTLDLDFGNGHCVRMRQGVWSERIRRLLMEYEP